MYKKRMSRAALLLACLMMLSALPVFADFSDDNVQWLDMTGVTFGHYYEGLAMIKQNNLYGFIDTAGEIVIPVVYDSAARFVEGKAVVRKGDQVGFIDKSNKFTAFAIPAPQTADDYIAKATMTYFAYNDGYVYLPHRSGMDNSDRTLNLMFDATGKRFVPKDAKFYPLGPVKDGKVLMNTTAGTGSVYMGLDGTPVLSRASISAANPDTEIYSLYVFDDGILPFSVLGEDDTLIGFTDDTGSIIIEPAFYDFWVYFSQSTYDFVKEGLISVRGENGLWGAIDTSGALVIHFEYEYGVPFFEGIATVCKDGLWGGIDKTGKTVIPFIYDEIDDCINGYIFVKKDGMSGIIDKTGAVVVPLIYPSGVSSVYDGVCMVSDAPGHVGLCTLPKAEVPAKTVEAKQSVSKIYVDGELVSFDAYTINDNNYFKLRDVASAVNGSAKQFNVTWDAVNKLAALVPGQAYTPVGGEMAAGTAGSKLAALSSDKLMLGGKEIGLTTYKIDGSNYVMLRDIGRALNFNVSWDAVNKAILVNTNESYSED